MAFIKVDLTKCPICKEIMQNPKCLICYHTFCLPCLKNIYKNCTIFKCPVCKCVQKVKDPLMFPDNIFIRKLTQSFISLESQNFDNFYVNCKFDLCSVHLKQPLELFCKDCNALVCCSCYIENHSKHEFIKLSNNSELERSIQFNFDKIDRLSQHLSNETEIFDRKKSNLLNNKKKIEDQIINLKDDLIAAIVCNSSELHNQLEEYFFDDVELVNNIIEELNVKKKECDKQRQELLNAIDSNNYHFLLNIPKFEFEFIKDLKCNSSMIYFHKNLNIEKTSNLLGSLSETENICKWFLVEKPILCFHLIYNIKYYPSTASIKYDALQNNVGVIASAFPFTEEKNYFEIEIMSRGQHGAIVVGIIFKHFEYNYQPGLLHNSWGYKADDGCIYSDGNILATCEECFEGDHMGVGIVKVDAGFNVYFTKNKLKFGDYYLGTNLEGAYPAIGMYSRGESAVFNESAPWQEM